MNRRVLAFAVVVELLTSCWLYGRAPTDGVRVWYPSIWAYMGEHGLIWATAVVILISCGVAAFRDRVRSDVLTAFTSAVAELVSTIYVWFAIPTAGDASRAWYTGKFSDYFIERSTTWCVLAGLASLVYWIKLRRSVRREHVEQ